MTDINQALYLLRCCNITENDSRSSRSSSYMKICQVHWKAAHSSGSDWFKCSSESCKAFTDTAMAPCALLTAADLSLKSTFVPLFFKDDKSWESLSPDLTPSGSFSFHRICVTVASTCTWEFARSDRWTRCSVGSVGLKSSGFFLNESA